MRSEEELPNVMNQRAWKKLIEHAGGPATLAKTLGVSRETLRMWALGKTVPHKIAQAAVNAHARSHGLPVPFSEPI